MAIITDFSQPVDGASNEFHENIPDHTLQALDCYFIKGYQPGGFVSAMIAENYKKALACADSANRARFWYVATWLMRYAPKGSTGSYEILKDWCDDKDGIQSTHKDKAEKAFEWQILSGENIT